MINKVKSFFTHKRCKSRLNNKGFSLIEIMVALGLITILTALGIPQYNRYRKSVKVGVVRSILIVPHRTMGIEESLGNKASSVDKGKITRTIKSKALDEFDITWDNTTANKWCFLMVAKPNAQNYSGFSGCIDNNGEVPQVGGEDISCNQAKTKATVTGDDGSGVITTCGSPTCPGSCTPPSGHNPCTVGGSGDKDDVKEGQPCEGATYTETASCSAGVCSL